MIKHVREWHSCEGGDGSEEGEAGGDEKEEVGDAETQHGEAEGKGKHANILFTTYTIHIPSYTKSWEQF